MSHDLVEIDIDHVHDNPNQPRMSTSAEVRESVKAGIEANGGAYPPSMAITVRPRAEGGYEILAGHHRTRAAREAGLTRLWAHVRELDDKEALMLLLTSNNQRGMTTIEVGKHATLMRDQHGLSVAEYAKAIGRSEATVYGYMQAYAVLEQYGGTKGPFKAVPTQALTGLYGLTDTEFVSGLLYQFRERGTTGPVAEKVIKLCKEGKPMWWAFNVAEGREPQAEGDTTEKQPRTSGGGSHRQTAAKTAIANPLTLTPDEAWLLVHVATTGETVERGDEFKAVLQRLGGAIGYKGSAADADAETQNGGA